MKVNRPNDIFDRVIHSSAERLASLGYRRHGRVMRKIDSGVAAIIEFQKSLKTTSTHVEFTINLAIVCEKLLEKGSPPLEKAGSIHAHLRERIGMLMPSRSDKWWDITNATDENSLAAEISDLVADKAAPHLQQYFDMGALVSLWKSGKSPGLTKTQRMRCLAKASALEASDI